MYTANTQAYEAYNFYVDALPNPLPLVVSPDFQSRDSSRDSGIANTSHSEGLYYSPPILPCPHF